MSCRAVVVVMALAGVAALPLEASESDLWSTVEGPSRAGYGEAATFVVHYGNLGPDPAEHAYVNLWLPAGVPAPLDELTDDQGRQILDSAVGTDTLGNVPLLFTNFDCDGLLLQLQSDDSSSPSPVHAIAPGEEGSFQLTVTFPMDLPRTGVLRVDAPPHLGGEIAPLGHGLCGDCDDIAGTCFGEPLSLCDLERAPAAAAHGSDPDDPSFACYPLENDLSGTIALIRRGGCEFALKAFNAESAGAVGVVIVNSGFCYGTVDPGCVISMAGWEGPTLIPVVMVSQLDGEPLIAAAETGEAVRLSLGGLRDRTPEVRSLIFQGTPAGTVTEDPNPANDGMSLAVPVNTVLPGGPVRPAGPRTGGRVP